MDEGAYVMIKRAISTLITMAKDRGKDISRMRFIRIMEKLEFGSEVDGEIAKIEPSETGFMSNSFMVPPLEEDGDDLFVAFLVNKSGASLSSDIVSAFLPRAFKRFNEIVIVTHNQKILYKAQNMYMQYRNYCRLDFMMTENLAFPPVAHALELRDIRHYRDGKKWGEMEGVNIQELPSIYRSDPLSMYFGAMPGEVITGISIGAGHSEAFRAYHIIPDQTNK